MIIKHAIQNYVKREEKKIRQRHEKKFQYLLSEKHRRNGTQPNPNKLVLNLTEVELSNEQYSALQFGLKHGIATSPRESDLFASAESVWEQLTRNNLLRNNFHSIERAKNTIRALTFNILDFDHKRISLDNKRIKIIKDLQATTVILKPDKGEGVVLISKDDYMKSMNDLFSDRRKFKPIRKDPTHTRLNSIQRYLRTLVNRGELDKDTYKTIRPQNAKPARAHGLPKIHKAYDRLPKFRPIIDTTGTTHYSVGKYISELLQPLTQNEFTLKDSFDAASRIKLIPSELFDQGYKFVSFDVESLFTNVPLQRTLEIIVDRIYNKKLIDTNLKKSTLRKLIRDTCTKTAFSCNNQLYEQIDGVSMGGSLGPVLANIIMTEFEQTIVKQLINRGLITFYCRYVDDTLLLIKPDTINIILDFFHKFDKNIRFTYDLFEDTTPHFLDINILTNGIGIYRKDTFTGQYTNFDSFVPWRQKISWIKALVNRIHSICSPNLLKSELKRLKTIISWNNFPSRIANTLIRRFSYDALNKIHRAGNKDKEDSITIWLSVPYIGDKTSQLLRSFKRKLRRCLANPNIEIKVREKTTKLCFYTNNKDQVPPLSKSHVVYKFNCPGCQSAYIGKTDRTLFVRTHEHAISDKESAIYKHLRTCDHLIFIRNLCNLPDTLNTDIVSPPVSYDKEYFTQVVRDNTTILDYDNNWNLLLYKEAYFIKRLSPSLNNGLKSSRELHLFS